MKVRPMRSTMGHLMAPPKKKVDEELLKKLASIMCTMEEMSDILGVSVDTLERRYADLIKEARSKGKMSLRRWQFQAAEKGNVACLIWLGKQHLGQSEKVELGSNEEKPLTLAYSPKTVMKAIREEYRKHKEVKEIKDESIIEVTSKRDSEERGKEVTSEDRGDQRDLEDPSGVANGSNEG